MRYCQNFSYWQLVSNISKQFEISLCLINRVFIKHFSSLVNAISSKYKKKILPIEKVAEFLSSLYLLDSKYKDRIANL